VSEVLRRSPSRRLVKIFNKHDFAVFLVDLCIKQPAAVWRDRQAIAKDLLGFQDSPDVFSGKVEVLDRLRYCHGLKIDTFRNDCPETLVGYRRHSCQRGHRTLRFEWQRVDCRGAPASHKIELVSVRGNLYAVEPNHGEIDKISPTGQITRVADISATQGNIVPTAVAYHGNFYVGSLNTFPIQDGSSKILKITPSGQVDATGFTTVLGLAFDHEGYMYVLENTTGNLFPTPFTGKVLRVTDEGVQEIASGLFLPTAMTFGPDGDLYVSNVGFGPPPIGLGEIVRITVPPVE
jgi:hypothetical protein